MLRETINYSTVSYLVEARKIHREIQEICDSVESTGEVSIDFELFENLINEIQKWDFIMSFSSRFINDIFSSPNGEFQNAVFDIQADIIEPNVHVATHQLDIKFSREDEKVLIKVVNRENIHIKGDATKNVVSRLLWEVIIIKYPKPFILSAERFGISLFYKELDFTKNRLVEELQNLSNDRSFNPFTFLEKESSRYAKPIKDNIDFTRDLLRIQRRKSDLSIDKSYSIDRIMEGYYKAKSNEIRFISKKRGTNRFDIPLHLASSSARGLSDLYFYLKHIAEPGQILIIDEPESHLSPTNQVLMARLLVFCVNSLD